MKEAHLLQQVRPLGRHVKHPLDGRRKRRAGPRGLIHMAHAALLQLRFRGVRNHVLAADDPPVLELRPENQPVVCGDSWQDQAVFRDGGYAGVGEDRGVHRAEEGARARKEEVADAAVLEGEALGRVAQDLGGEESI